MPNERNEQAGPHAQSSGPAAVDRDALLRAVDGDEAEALALAGVFLSTANALADELERAVLGCDGTALLASCHEIGTSLGIVGATRGERLARGIERSLRAGLTVDRETSGLQLLQELRRVIAQLGTWCECGRIGGP